MVIFRCDGNKNIGAGHIMRCLSIADAFSFYKFEEKIKTYCIFATSDSTFASVIKEHNHESVILHTDYKNMDNDIPHMKDLLEQYKPHFLFVDSYTASVSYLTALQELCSAVGGKLVYIDDVLAFAYPCDILINYNIYGAEREEEYRKLYHEAKRKIPVLLLGTRFAPLRKEFQKLPKRIVNKEANRILISTGGADPDHMAKNIAQYLANHSKLFSDFIFDFVIGALNDDLEEIKKYAELNQTMHIYTNVTNMQILMSNADLAISAAGSTLYELCATQTPTVTYVLADNQIPGARAFMKQGILMSVGDIRKLGVEKLSEKTIYTSIDLAKNYQERCRISGRQRRLVDGRGSERIVKELRKNM